MNQLDTARAVLAAASLVDSTMPKPDINVLRMWAEILGDVDIEAAKRAIVAHYAAEHRKVMPADILRRVQIDAEAQKAAARVVTAANHNAVPDADPDDVPAYLAALRSGRLIDRSPKPDTPARPIQQLVDAAATRHAVPNDPAA